MQQLEGLSAQGAKLLNGLRERCNKITAWKNKILWSVVDASFCNRTVFQPSRSPHSADRKSTQGHSSLWSRQAEASANAGRGRKASYGSLLPTPEQLRQDPEAPWQKCPIFAAGKKHQLNYKTIAPVFWRSGAATRPMRLIVIRPLRYRAHGHTLYRQPAYLLVSNPNIPVALGIAGLLLSLGD